MSLYLRLSRKEHGEGARIAVTLLAGLIVVVLIPVLIVVGGPAVDKRLGLAGAHFGAWNLVLGGLLLLAGLSVGLWSVLVQLTRGRGSPVPVMPTQELLTDGPYGWCRNPMTLGAFLAYAGFAIGAGTIAGAAFALCIAALLLFYLKRYEERELAERFGEAYVAYKREVPFMVPRSPSRRRRGDSP